MKIKTSDATPEQLNWLVAKLVGDHYVWWSKEGRPFERTVDDVDPWFEPSTDPAQAWPIIDREGIGFYKANSTKWWAHPYGGEYNAEGTTSLIAAMRCYVASKLGDEVDVPEDLQHVPSR